MTVCRSCQAEIAWARTTTGGRMPLDADQVRDGNVVAQPDGLVRALRSGEEPDPSWPRYRSHFATCPQAGSHRKPKPGPAQGSLF